MAEQLPDQLRIQVPDGYAMGVTTNPRGLDATEVVLLVWPVEHHQAFSVQVPIALTPLQRMGLGIERAAGILARALRH